MMAAEGLPVQVAVCALEVSESGYYEWRNRTPSQRAIRHERLTDVIRDAHVASRGTYGIARIHAELTLGRGIAVGHGQVELLMRRAGIHGVTGRPKWRNAKPDNIARDLVERAFARTGPNQLWVTDITEPSARARARSTAASCSTPSPDGSWAGRSTPLPGRRSSRTRSAWPSKVADPSPAR